MFSKLSKFTGFVKNIKSKVTLDKSKLCYNNETAERFKVNFFVFN